MKPIKATMFVPERHYGIKLLVLVSTISGCPAQVYADDAAVEAQDKSQYNLFDPVPDDQMRSFSTDRPTKSDSPYTVDAGHFQYEADIVNWTYDNNTSSKTMTSSVVAFDPTLKAGLTQNTDLEVVLSPINVNQTHYHVTATQSTLTGVGDIYTRVKYNMFGNEGGDYALAVVPYVKAPTAARNIGNGHWEGGGYVPFIASLPDGWTLDITSELDVLEDANVDGVHNNYQNLINFSHSLFSDALTGYIEFWSDLDTDHNASTQYTLDFAVSWLIKDNFQLDAGVNVGLNNAANDVQPYLGISQRF